MKQCIRFLATRRLVPLGAAASFLACCGCGDRPATHLYIGLDASGSARQTLGAYVVLTQSLSDQLQPYRDRLTLYRVDHAVEEFSDDTYDGDAEKHLKTMIAECQRPCVERGTRPASFWSSVADRAVREKSPVVIFLMSDGDNDDHRTESDVEIHRAAKRLAGCPQVRVVAVCGARRDNWKSLRTTLAPLGDRLRLLSPPELQPQAAVALLEQAR